MMTNPRGSQSNAQHSEESLRWMQRFQSLLTATAATVFEQDTDLRYTWIVDPSAIFDVKTSLGKTDEELFPAAEATLLTKMKRTVLKHGTGATEIFCITGSKKVVTIEMAVGPLVNNRGEIIGIGGILRDIAKAFDGNVADSATELSQPQRDHQRYLNYLSGRLTDIRDDERNRFTHELHDLIGPIVTALSMDLHTLDLLLDAQSTDRRVLSLLEDTRALAEEMGELVRNFMLEIQPPPLDGFSLIPYLRTYKNAYAQRVDMNTTIKEDSFPTLPPDVEYTLFRIIREALYNAGKHSDADFVTISLTTNGGKAHVTIADNGCGFDVENTSRENALRSWGLVLMKERAEMIGGQLTIESTLGEGTSVIVELQQ